MLQNQRMSKQLVSLYFVFVLTYAAPKTSDREAQILTNKYTIDEKGNYKFSFETSNGISREESGIVFEEGQNNEPAIMIVIGRYSYLNEEGKNETIRYIADDKGYRILTFTGTDTSYALPANAVATLLGK